MKKRKMPAKHARFGTEASALECARLLSAAIEEIVTPMRLPQGEVKAAKTAVLNNVMRAVPEARQSDVPEVRFAEMTGMSAATAHQLVKAGFLKEGIDL